MPSLFHSLTWQHFLNRAHCTPAPTTGATVEESMAQGHPSMTSQKGAVTSTGAKKTEQNRKKERQREKERKEEDLPGALDCDEHRNIQSELKRAQADREYQHRNRPGLTRPALLSCRRISSSKKETQKLPLFFFARTHAHAIIAQFTKTRAPIANKRC
jgi:hypothetical protein